jgi:hypothetical protein
LQGDALLKLRFHRDLSEQWFGLTHARAEGRVGGVSASSWHTAARAE